MSNHTRMPLWMTPMSNSTRIAERQPTDTSSPMPVDVARDLLATVRALEARVAVLEDLLASAITPPMAIDNGDYAGRGWVFSEYYTVSDRTPSAAISAALRLPTVPDAYGR